MRHGPGEERESPATPGVCSMRFSPRLLPCVASLGFLIATATAQAESPPDPLRLIPEQADLFFKIEKPRQLLDAVNYYDLLQELQKLPPVREQLESTNVR